MDSSEVNSTWMNLNEINSTKINVLEMNSIETNSKEMIILILVSYRKKLFHAKNYLAQDIIPWDGAGGG